MNVCKAGSTYECYNYCYRTTDSVAAEEKCIETVCIAKSSIECYENCKTKTTSTEAENRCFDVCKKGAPYSCYSSCY